MAEALQARDKVRDVKDRAGDRPEPRALLRWWGWIEPLHLNRPEEQLLLASLLEFPELSAFGRVWAERIGRPVDRLVPVGDAPSWTGRAEGLKRWLGGQAVNADPWRLFPAWIRDQLPVPPGDATPKTRRLDFLAALQRAARPGSACAAAIPRRPGPSCERSSSSRGFTGGSPRRPSYRPRPTCSRIASFKAGKLVMQDLASQAVGIVCDPDPGERWWDVRGEVNGGLHAFHLAALMGGKGSVVCTFDPERRRHEAALRLRRGAFHNITTKVREGNHPIGQAAELRRRIVERPLIGHRHLAPPSRRPLDRHRRSNPRLAAEQAPFAGRRKHPGQARRASGLHCADPDPHRDDRRGRGVPGVASRIPVAALPASAGRYDDRRHALHLAPPARLRWPVHRADDPEQLIAWASGGDRRCG